MSKSAFHFVKKFAQLASKVSERGHFWLLGLNVSNKKCQIFLFASVTNMPNFASPQAWRVSEGQH